MEIIKGTGVALITPFNEDLSIDYVGLEKLIIYQIEGGIDYLVLMGTTGESAVLSKQEKQAVIAFCIKVNNGILPIVVGIGGNNTLNVVEEIKNTDLSAFCAILSVSPYYNKPTQEGIYQHFRAISEASPLPIIVYNVPGRTGKNFEPKTVLRLANDFKNIVAVKEAAGDIVQAMRIIKDKPKDFMVISGDDMIALPMVLAGGSGVISVIGQGFPKQFSELIRFGLDRNVDEALRMVDALQFVEENGEVCPANWVKGSTGMAESHDGVAEYLSTH